MRGRRSGIRILKALSSAAFINEGLICFGSRLGGELMSELNNHSYLYQNIVFLVLGPPFEQHK